MSEKGDQWEIDPITRVSVDPEISDVLEVYDVVFGRLYLTGDGIGKEDYHGVGKGTKVRVKEVRDDGSLNVVVICVTAPASWCKKDKAKLNTLYWLRRENFRDYKLVR